VDEIEALDRAEPVHRAEETLEQLGAVADAIEAVPALVEEDGLEALGSGHPHFGAREEPSLGRGPPRRDETDLERHLPELIPRGRRGAGQRLRQIREALLAQHQLAALEPRAHERVAGLEE